MDAAANAQTAGFDSGSEPQSTRRSGDATDAGIGVVLLVDDEPLLLKSLRRMLAADGQRVLTAGPLEIDAPLADPALDVVLLDLRMGTTSGLDVLDRLKRERPSD